uniref:Putative methyltransferase n=1 Tax=viral metagenome TaxID=1070528 RepID=A0A6H1ZK94_9ZZZZ
MKSNIAHNIKHRDKPNNEFYTPQELADKLVKLVPVKSTDIICDNAYGTGVFLKAFDEIDVIAKQSTKDFFNWKTKQHWFITNPPYSDLDKWLEHTCKYSIKGFAYLLGLHNLTPRRIEMCEKQGFKITQIHLCKVFKWFGISAFIVWEKKNKKVSLTYDRVVWR